MGFPEIAALTALAGSAAGMPACVLMDSIKISAGRAAEIDIMRNRQILWGMSLASGSLMLLLKQPWLMAGAACVPGIIACEVTAGIGERARRKERRG